MKIDDFAGGVEAHRATMQESLRNALTALLVFEDQDGRIHLTYLNLSPIEILGTIKMLDEGFSIGDDDDEAE